MATLQEIRDRLACRLDYTKLCEEINIEYILSICDFEFEKVDEDFYVFYFTNAITFTTVNIRQSKYYSEIEEIVKNIEYMLSNNDTMYKFGLGEHFIKIETNEILRSITKQISLRCLETYFENKFNIRYETGETENEKNESVFYIDIDFPEDATLLRLTYGD